MLVLLWELHWLDLGAGHGQPLGGMVNPHIPSGLGAKTSWLVLPAPLQSSQGGAFQRDIPGYSWSCFGVGGKSMWSCKWQLDLPHGRILARLITPRSLLNAFSPRSDVWHTCPSSSHPRGIANSLGVFFSQSYLLQNTRNESRFANSPPSLGFLGGCWGWVLTAGGLTTPWGPAGKSHKESLPVKKKKNKRGKNEIYVFCSCWQMDIVL